jgi:hypothetical protein
MLSAFGVAIACDRREPRSWILFAAALPTTWPANRFLFHLTFGLRTVEIRTVSPSPNESVLSSHHRRTMGCGHIFPTSGYDRGFSVDLLALLTANQKKNYLILVLTRS